jgi:NADPH:quinone reductase-like Zn-dependent oxidoreductase
MRAVLIKDGKGPVENLYLGEEATPEPEEGQVQVQVSSILLVVWYKLTSRSK